MSLRDPELQSQRDSQQIDERSRLLNHQGSSASSDPNEDEEVVEFGEDDEEDPKQWPLRWKYLQVFLVFIIGVVGPMASSIFAPAIDEVARTFNSDAQTVLAGQTVFVCMLGIGPLFLAPMSETFGRRNIFLINLAIFTLLQIPTALAPNVESFIVLRLLSGFFGSVGVANGGGTISDIFDASERAPAFGFYLLGPLLGPTIAGAVGGLVLSYLGWRWIFWVMLTISAVITTICFFCLHESRAVAVLQQRKKRLEKENPDTNYVVKGVPNESIFSRIISNSTRASKILVCQPIVTTMAAYQALIFASMYSLYSNYATIWSDPPYNFGQTQVALTYLSPAIGFIVASCFIVPLVDRIYKSLAEKNGEGKPEYRLPLANIGAIFLPASLFWFGWTVEKQLSWPIPLASALLFGAGQVAIFNCSQNYYLDAFESYAASALAAGAFLRSLMGGIIPLFVPRMFEDIGYGWGMSVFGILSVLLMPAPLLFYYYGEMLRKKFAFNP